MRDANIARRRLADEGGEGHERRSGAAAAKADLNAGGGFVRFFEREWPKLKTYLRRLVGAEDVEDVAQEAFARLYEAREQVRSPGGLLYRTARNLAADRKRAERRWRARAGGIDGIEDPHPSPEDQVHWRLKLERTAQVLARMSPKCRRVFVLRVAEGCSYAEIAERCGMTQTAVEKQLLRAFETCAEWAESEGEPQAQYRRARVR